MNKITIIGAGSVGSTIAYTLAISGLVSEIALIDVRHEKALGEAMDIDQGMPFARSCSVYAGSYPDAADSDIVILTSGVPRKPGQTRLDLARTNVDIVKSIVPQIVTYAPDAVYVIVANPVDIMTYAFCKYSGLQENQVLGSGTILDTARLRAHLASHFGVNQANAHAYVMGEHGDSSFIPWSLANISNIPVGSYQDSVSAAGITIAPLDIEAAEEHVRSSGAKVIERKGVTNYAIASAVTHICRSILAGIDTPMTVSSMMHGEYGISDVCLSVLSLVGRDGVRGKLLPRLTEKEAGLLRHSAECLQSVIRDLGI